MDDHLKDEIQLRSCLKLHSLKGLNNANKCRLLAHYKQANAIFDAPPDEIKSLLLVTGAKLKTASNQHDDERLDQQLDLLHQHKINILLHNAPEYPAQLKQLNDAPPVLFTRGDINLLNGPQLAIVGSRNASPSGLKTAKDFAADFARSGLTITSGLALGIDSAAHLGAVNEIGRTIAVVATGLDQVYPQRNLALAKEIVNKGLMISEFPPLTPPRREHFPRRNRLISGLSLGVLVVEADTRSGSLITARLAGEQGREIFAIPGSIHLPTSRGCHQLIRQGAKLVETTTDVLEELKPALEIVLNTPSSEVDGGNEPRQGYDANSLAILKLVDFAPTQLDAIAIGSNLPIERVSSILLQLELAGEIAPLPGSQYQRIQRQ